MIALDTSAIIEFTKGNNSFVGAVDSAEKSGESVAVTSVSLFELLTPIFHKNLLKKESVIRSFLHNVKVLPLDAYASEESAKIMAALLKVGKPVNVLDVLVAGIAQANGCERLIGHDKDFNEIAKVIASGLNIEIF